MFAGLTARMWRYSVVWIDSESVTVWSWSWIELHDCSRVKDKTVPLFADVYIAKSIFVGGVHFYFEPCGDATGSEYDVPDGLVMLWEVCGFSVLSCRLFLIVHDVMDTRCVGFSHVWLVSRCLFICVLCFLCWVFLHELLSDISLKPAGCSTTRKKNHISENTLSGSVCGLYFSSSPVFSLFLCYGPAVWTVWVLICLFFSNLLDVIMSKAKRTCLFIAE